MSDKFIFTVRPVDRHALSALAQADGLSQAATLRQLVRREARARGLLPDVGQTQSQTGGNRDATATGARQIVAKPPSGS